MLGATTALRAAAALRAGTALRRLPLAAARALSVLDGAPEMSGEERRLADMVTEALSAGGEHEVRAQVMDESGGCGRMYRVMVETEAFQGVPLVKQHRMVADALGTEITEKMHGLTIKTMVPKTE